MVVLRRLHWSTPPYHDVRCGLSATVGRNWRVSVTFRCGVAIRTAQ